MNPGMMRTPLLWKQRTQAQGYANTPTYTYASGVQLFGQITDCTSDEKTNHMKLSEIVTHRIRMQFYPGISAKDRIVASASRDGSNAAISKTFEIVSVLDYLQQGAELRLICREVAA